MIVAQHGPPGSLGPVVATCGSRPRPERLTTIAAGYPTFVNEAHQHSDPRATTDSGVRNAIEQSVTTPFEEPALWRADIIADFRLRGEERCAAASPVPGFPQILRSVVSVLEDVPDGPWVDIGGGLGGVSSWLERHLGVETIVLDAEVQSLRAARRLFPSLRTAACDVSALPLGNRSAAVAIVSGVASLLDDLDAMLGEVRRTIDPAGVLVVVDLWSTSQSTRRHDPNTFWSIEEFALRADGHGLVRTHVAVADTTTGWWSGAARQVSDEIDRRYAGREAYRAWRSDQDHLQAVIESGTVLPAGVVMDVVMDAVVESR